jgi:hypothetical protein
VILEYPPVLNKVDFAERYRKGEFGNHSPTWDSVEEFGLAEIDEGLFHLRNRIVGGPTYYSLEALDLIDRHADLMDAGVADTFYVSQMVPLEVEQGLLIQGEVQRGIWGLDLTYSTVAKPMRDALRERTQYAQGLIASLLLQHYLDANSYDWLMTLLDRYPGHVVEFGTYEVCWGTLPNNTIYWEVRAY